jgi:hypothetical protein
MWKFLNTLQLYFDHGLLRPENAVLAQEHKNFIIDSVIGLEEGGTEKLMFNRHFMNSGGWFVVFLLCFVGILPPDLFFLAKLFRSGKL